MADQVNIREIWGVLEPTVLERIVVISPHFDDAALGAAHLLATYPGSTVITVLGGQPPAYPDHVTPWDEAGGFVTGDDVVSARREEDRQAMASVKATPVWLEFPDHQYLAVEERPTPADIWPDLEKAIADANPTAVFLPMGIANPDHVLTHEAGLLARRELLGSGNKAVWFCYEDHGYKHLPGNLAWRISKLFRAGIWPTPSIVPIDLDMAQKRELIAIYKTQVAPLEQDHMLKERLDANVPEQFWRLSPPVPVIEEMLLGDE
jgi:LmbE family N-acetylglucosaminyl deacetylase